MQSRPDTVALRDTSLGDTLEIIADDGVIIRAQVLGSDSAPRLVVGHGNGLAAAGYASFWSQLVNDYQLVLLDFRGHGRSDSGPIEQHSWPQFVHDFDTVMRTLGNALGERTTFGAFHSLSSIVALMHARRFGTPFERLVLFDPPLFPEADHPLQPAHIEEMYGLARRVAKRRVQFDHWKALADQLRGNAMYARCLPQACDEMARALLRPVVEDGKTVWRLSCPPTHESKIFASNDDPSLWSALPTLGDRVKLVCADPSVPGVQPSAAVGRDMAARLGLNYEYVPGTTHFLQLENPDACAAITKAFCREAVGAPIAGAKRG